MINKQKLSYKIWEEQIPISKNLDSFLKRMALKNQTLFRMEMIIRYYLLLMVINLESLNALQRN